MPRIKKRGKLDIHFRHNLKVYLSLFKKYKLLAFSLTLIILLVEASYVVPRLLFKVIIDRGTEFTNNTLSGEAFLSILIWIAVIYLTVIIFAALAKFLRVHLVNKLEAGMITDLKRNFYNHIVHLSHNFHTTHKTGSLISRLIRGGNATERMTDVLVFNVSPLFFQLAIVAGSLLYFDVLSALTVVIMVVLFLWYSIYLQNKQRFSNYVRTIKEDVERAYISDTMINVDSIKNFGKESVVKKRFKYLSEITKSAYIKFWDYFRWLDMVQQLILGFGIFFLILFPMRSFLAGNMSLGSIVFIYTVYGNLYGPLFGFVHGIRTYYRVMADFEALFKYGKIENEIKDGPKKLKIKKAEVEFKNIDFRYHKYKIFKNFNLKIKKNQKVALVGHSGCGKTTLVKLLYRLYDVDAGEVLIDGQNIKHFKQESLRSELSVVPQECVLFDDTLYNNIAFSNPKADRKAVLKAMKFAQLDKIVANFPNKENTIVGERGVRLSGGEKQRVSIARAILADKKILVLDEATSNLDSETEHEIQSDLRNLMKNRTSIMIAHRLSTIMHADKIIVMEKGKIVQQGKHRDLIKQKGVYKKLWNLQKGGYIR